MKTSPRALAFVAAAVLVALFVLVGWLTKKRDTMAQLGSVFGLAAGMTVASPLSALLIAHFGNDPQVPADRRGTFTVTADSDAAIPVSFQVDCPVPVKVVLDGNEVTVPVELTPGRHQLSVSGRFQPKS